MSTTEVRKEPRWEEGVSVHFSEKKSRSLILPRPPTGPLLLGSRHAAGIFVDADSDQSKNVRCARAPSWCGGLGAASAQRWVPARRLCCGFCSPKGRFFFGSASCWAQSERAV